MADGETGEIDGGVDVNFAHDIAAMDFDGGVGDEEGGGDLAGGLAFGDELEDFAFARGEEAAGRAVGWEEAAGGVGGNEIGDVG